MPVPLPPDLEAQLTQLRQKGRTPSNLADILEKRWHAATDDEARARVVRSVEQLARPSRAKYFVLLVIAVPLAFLGLYALANVRYAEAVRSGERAVAEVRRLEEGFCWFGTKTSDCIEVHLTVTPRTGPPFDASLTYDLSHRWLSRVQPGSLIYVSIDREEERTVRLDEEALAGPAPSSR